MTLLSPLFVVVKASSSCVYNPPCYGGLPSLLLFKGEIAVTRHGQDEGSGDQWLVSGWHDSVAIWVAVQKQYLGDFIPRDELELILIPDVVLIGRLLSRVDVEADHAPDKVHAD
jgi:hypothetical protein